MNILIGISYYTPNISGLTIYAQRLAQGLSKRGHSVEVITSRHNSKLKYEEELNSVKIKRVWTPWIIARGPIMPTYIVESIRSVQKADVVNCHLPQFESVVLAILAKILRKRIILTYHCDLSNWPGFLNKVAITASYSSHFISGMIAENIIVYTQDYANHSKYLSYFKHKIKVIPPLIEKDQVNGKVTLPNWKKSKITIGFAGRIAREKGIQYLLRTLPTLKMKLGSDIKIVFAGPMTEVIGSGINKELMKMFTKFKKHVVFLGPLTQAQMTIFYKSIDVLVLPSTERLEAFGLVQVEAMLSGCPVIATDLPGVRIPIQETGMGRIVKPEDSQELSLAVIDVLSNPKKYAKDKRILQNVFNYQNSMDKYESLFASL